MNAANDAPDLAETLDQALADGLSSAAVLDGDLSDLLNVAQRLEISGAQVIASPEFRATARQRLILQMARSSAGDRPKTTSIGRRVRVVAMRFVAGLATLGVAGAAAATASASALPGEPLYPVKQAAETVELQLVTTDSARDEILVQHADARLDEAGRLLEQGRAGDAETAVARYADTLDNLTASTRSEAEESNLRTSETRLSELSQAGLRPGPDLERALAATKRRLGPAQAAAPKAEAEVPNTEITSTPGLGPSARPSEQADEDAERAPEARGPVDIGARSATGASGESDAPDAAKSHAAPAHRTTQPALPQPGRGAPQPAIAVSRSQPGGRGRP